MIIRFESSLLIREGSEEFLRCPFLFARYIDKHSRSFDRSIVLACRNLRDLYGIALVRNRAWGQQKSAANRGIRNTLRECPAGIFAFTFETAAMQYRSKIFIAMMIFYALFSI